MDRSSVELLDRACELVRTGWSQHADARTAEGVDVKPWRDTAASWSLVGSLVAALEERSDRGRELPLGHLAAALNELAEFIDDDSLDHWNDAPSRTQDDVTDVLEAAANSAASKLPSPRAN